MRSKTVKVRHGSTVTIGRERARSGVVASIWYEANDVSGGGRFIGSAYMTPCQARQLAAALNQMADEQEKKR